MEIKQGVYGVMYQKMISYVYEYQNGERGRNIGFVKMALQNLDFKVKLQLRQAKFYGKELEVYGFIREEGKLYTAYFGRLMLNQGFGEKMISGECKQVWKERDFLKMNGFLLFPSGQRDKGIPSYFCATQWDDEPLTLDSLVAAEEPEEALEEKQEQYVLHAAQLEDEKMMEADPVPEETDWMEADQMAEKTDRMEADPVSEKREWMEANPVSEEMDRMATDPERMAEDDRMSENERLEDIAEKTERQEETAPVQEPDAWELFEKRRQTMREKWEKISEACKQEKEMQRDWEQGEEILRKFPVLNPFFDQQVLASVRIEPKDLGNFPMEHWYLANNSFLLHGYYYYRHLLFLKMRNREEVQYAIAVPGNNEHRERFMANMFGFEQFKGVKNSENADFGYWWKRIE